ncbi:MAG: hypothetical protein AAB263_11375 [Planctomycetota bacterium]
MRILVLLSALIGLHAAEPIVAPAATQTPVILITAFKPFAGRGVNGSETVARSFDGKIIAGCRVHVLVMSVLWGEPAKQIPKLVAELKPKLALGLGEGYPERITVEHVGRNEAKPIPDEAGKKPSVAKLQIDGPATRPMRLQFDQAWFADAKPPVMASQDAGGYLCNEALYTILGTTAEHAGFVHLPPQEQTASERYIAELRPLVLRLIEKNLAVKPALK